MEAWIPTTLVAALLQTWRTALQQRLRGVLGVQAAGFVRYCYALPTDIVLLAVFAGLSDAPLPHPDLRFIVLCALGGLMQIFGTVLLIRAFGYRNFAVGTAYAKTEALQGALIGLALLGDHLSALAWLGIGIGVIGVLVLSLAGRGLRGRALLAATIQPAALCGLGAGFCFTLTGQAVRVATTSMASPDPVVVALMALLITNLLQTLMQGTWLAATEKSEFIAAFTHWRSSIWIGTLSAVGSACWFFGFASAPVALVRALGQVEMVFTLGFSRFYLREVLRGADIAGLVLVVAGVILVLLGR
jgi:drug/metabolite transporter (DMT)-like permease